MVQFSVLVFERVRLGKNPDRGLSGTDRSKTERSHLRHRNVIPRRQSDLHATGYSHKAWAPCPT